MRIGPDGNASGGRDLKTFPVERMRKAAGDIVSNANSSLAQHEATWRRVQGYIDSFPGFMQGPVRAVLSGYDRRLRESYQAGFTHAHIQAIITRIKTAQQDPHGTDKLSLTVEQIRALVVKIAAAVNSSDEDVQLEGEVARALINDVVAFQVKFFDAHGVEIGQIDVETANAIIEVTNGTQTKRRQVIKEQTDPRINPKGKRVILYAPDYSRASGDRFVIPGLPDIPIIRSLKDLFDYLRRL